MPFQLSPGVAVVEKDFTSIVPAVSSSVGATIGSFSWGPVMEPVTVSSENDLVARFGKPNDSNFNSFFTAANFLSYTNNLLLVRADSGHLNAVATPTGGLSTVTITAAGSGYASAPAVTVGAPNDAGGIQAVVTATMVGGAVTALTITTAGTGYTSAPSITIAAPGGGGGVTATATATVQTGGVKIINAETYTSTFSSGAGVVGMWAGRYPGTLGNSLKVSMADSATFTGWTYEAEFDAAPGTSPYTASVGGSGDEMHIIVIDEDGAWTGTAGTVLERYAFVSKGSDAKKSDGTNNFYKDVINSRSEYIWWMDHSPVLTDAGTACAGNTFVNLSTVSNSSLSGGTDDFVLTDGEKQSAFSLFNNAEQYDVSLIMAGKASATVAQHIIGICESRLDCVAFISPEKTSNGDVIIGYTSTEISNITAYRDALSSSSYAVLDSGYKYQYDRYNDKYRYVPLNGDVSGLCARTDFTNDPWFSPSGLNRGQIKNVVRLAVNPNKAQRDTLYKKGVNPVVTFPGEGTVLFGDKTLLAKPSAFDRINVRRLFIVMEKAIATAAKFQLFEFNDPFTRAQFKNLVEPFLRDVQGRRGITDFVVKCDESNNTGQVIDANEFVADIFVKPNRSINFITLNFVAARSAINFTEIGA